MNLTTLFVLLSLLPLGVAQGADAPYISVGQARTKKSVIALVEPRATPNAQAKAVLETTANDLIFSDLFKILGSAAYLEDKNAGITPGSFKMSDWSTLGADFLVKTSAKTEGNRFELTTYLYDVHGGKQILGKNYVASVNETRDVGHRLANQILEALTGLPGIFESRIAMVCDRTGKKELYVMNFDGTDVKQITRHRSTVVSPAWSPDGKRVAYSVYTRNRQGIKNLGLYEFNFSNSTVRQLSNQRGTNSGAAYSPDGKKIALTLSYTGNPEIFLLDLATKATQRLTTSVGFDVDPAWSPNGSEIAFVSTRSGNPMIFKMGADGSNPSRLTFAGKYNATPSWSPRGGKLAFAGWLDGHFDIFVMNADGTTIERLTKDQGNNEDPTYSPDGNFLLFTSNRTGQNAVYVMNSDGTSTKRLSFGLGNCTSAKWSVSASRGD